MSRDKIYKALNKLQIGFTEAQMKFLDEQRVETGDTKSAIVRRAVNYYKDYLVAEKLKRFGQVDKGTMQIAEGLAIGAGVKKLEDEIKKEKKNKKH